MKKIILLLMCSWLCISANIAREMVVDLSEQEENGVVAHRRPCCPKLGVANGNANGNTNGNVIPTQNCAFTTGFITASDGNRIFYRQQGNVPGRQTVFFIHGLGQQSCQWACEQAFLCNQYNTVAIDLLGHGDSDKPFNPLLYSAQNVANELMDVLNALGIVQPIVVGHSMGVPIAIQLALNGVPSKLILVDGTSQITPTRPGINPYGIDGIFLTQLFIFLTLNDCQGAVDFAVPFLFNENCPTPEFNLLTQRIGNEFIQSCAKPGFIMALENYVLNWNLGNYNFLDIQMNSIAIPTLIIHGSIDQSLLPIAGEHMRDVIPNSYIVMFNGKGHFSHLTDINRFHRNVIDFLTGDDLLCAPCSLVC